MKTVTTIGIDLAKNSFSVYGVNAIGKPILSRTLSWAGVRATANMRFVPHKSPEQTDIQCIHRIRQGYVKSRTALINQTRGLLAEYGIAIRQGICAIRNQLPALITDEENDLSGLMRRNLASLYESLCFLDERILEQDKLLKAVVKENEACQRLMQVPGIGIMTATILLTIAGVHAHSRHGIQTSGIKLRLSCRLQRGVIACEPLASGPPNADGIKAYPRLPRKKRWKNGRTGFRKT